MKRQAVLLTICLLLTLFGSACRKQQSTDFSALPLTDRDVSFDGTNVLVALPTDKLVERVADKEGHSWSAPNDGPKILLTLHTGAAPRSLDAAKEAVLAGVKPGVSVTRAEKIGGAFLVTWQHPDSTFFAVTTFVPVDQGAIHRTLKCVLDFALGDSAQIEYIAAQRAWAEKLCLSARAK